MTIFAGWRGELPATIDKGTQVSSCIKVKGFRNVVHWTVTRYDEPNSIELQGRGRGGIRITVAMAVTDMHPGSTFDLTAMLSGECSADRSAMSWPECCVLTYASRWKTSPPCNKPPDYRWRMNHSRSAWRIRLRSMASQSRPAPRAINPTIAAVTPAPACPSAKLVTHTTSASTAAPTTSNPGVRTESCGRSSLLCLISTSTAVITVRPRQLSFLGTYPKRRVAKRLRCADPHFRDERTQSGSHDNNRRAGRVSMALTVNDRRVIRHPTSVDSYSSS